MPHECTNCGRTFDDGSKQMLSGCPDCGGNKFQFRPAGRDSGDDTEASSPADAGTSSPADPASSPAGPASSPTDPGSTSTADADASGTDDASAVPAPDAPSADSSETVDAAEAAETADAVDAEDHAQQAARSSTATPDDIDGAGGRSPSRPDEGSAPEAEPDPESTAGRTRGTPQGPPTEAPSGADADEFVLSGAVGPDDGEPVEKQPVAGSAPEAENAADDTDDADLKSLREELNDQFESIKITEPGRYELNLMELYDRQEYIISLQEDGRYVIEMAENYGTDDR